MKTNLHLTDVSNWLSESAACISTQHIESLCHYGVQRIECGYASNSNTHKAITHLNEVMQPGYDPVISVVNPALSNNNLIRKCSGISMQFSTSESFSAQPFGKSVRDRLIDIEDICELSRAVDIPVRIYIHAAICCPYEGTTSPQTVAGFIARMLRFGCDEFIQMDDCANATDEDIQSLNHVLSAQTAKSRLGFMISDTNPNLKDVIRVSKEFGIVKFCCSESKYNLYPLSENKMAVPQATTLMAHFESNL